MDALGTTVSHIKILSSLCSAQVNAAIYITVSPLQYKRILGGTFLLEPLTIILLHSIKTPPALRQLFWTNRGIVRKNSIPDTLMSLASQTLLSEMFTFQCERTKNDYVPISSTWSFVSLPCSTKQPEN